MVARALPEQADLPDALDRRGVPQRHHGAARRNRGTGLWEDAYRSGRSDMAVVRSLRDGRRRIIAVRLLILHEDEGLRSDGCSYPTRPELRFYRRQPAWCAARAA